MSEIWERMARIIDPIAWDETQWDMTRGKIIGMHERREAANTKAGLVLAELPLTPEQLEGLASGDMVVVDANEAQWIIKMQEMAAEPEPDLQAIATAHQQEEQP